MLAGNIIVGFCQYGLLAVLAKKGSPEMVGQYTLGLAICTPIFQFANMQLRSVQATDATHIFDFVYYIGLRIITSSSAFIAIVCLLMLSNYQMVTKMVILMVGVVRISDSVSDIIYGYCQQKERLDFIAISMVIKYTVSLIAFAYMFISSTSLVKAIFIIFIVHLLNLLIIDLPTAFRLRVGAVTQKTVLNWLTPQGRTTLMRFQLNFRWNHMRRLLKMVLPLGFGSVIMALNTSVPRFFIEYYLGEYQLGIFGALAYPMLAGVAIVHALAQSASHRLGSYYCRNEKVQFKSLMRKLVLIGAAIGGIALLFAIVWGEFLLTLLYKPEYAQHTTVFVVLMGVAMISYMAMFQSYALVATKLFRTQLLINTAALFVSVICSVGLIERYETMGAAISVGGGYIVILIGSYLALKSGKRPKNDKAFALAS
jgi:O-antigen/teichoic acid export membrane protein